MPKTSEPVPKIMIFGKNVYLYLLGTC